MVDLAKIRKKGKKGASPDGETTAGEPAIVDSPKPAGEAPAATTVDVESTARAAAASVESKPAGGAPAAPLASAPSKLERFKAEAGQRREAMNVAVEVEAATEATDAATQLEVLTFVLAGEQYAVDIEKIVEIVTPRAVTKVPNAGDSVIGIMSLRGTIVTLLDVRGKLRHRGATPAPDPRIVVVDQGGETVGFEVDRVLRVLKVEHRAVQPHPVVHASEQDEAIRGVFRQKDSLTILLDFDKLLA